MEIAVQMIISFVVVLVVFVPCLILYFWISKIRVKRKAKRQMDKIKEDYNKLKGGIEDERIYEQNKERTGKDGISFASDEYLRKLTEREFINKTETTKSRGDKPTLRGIEDFRDQSELRDIHNIKSPKDSGRIEWY